jgi:hypothetical protein
MFPCDKPLFLILYCASLSCHGGFYSMQGLVATLLRSRWHALEYSVQQMNADARRWTILNEMILSIRQPMYLIALGIYYRASVTHCGVPHFVELGDH